MSGNVVQNGGRMNTLVVGRHIFCPVYAPYSVRAMLSMVVLGVPVELKMYTVGVQKYSSPSGASLRGGGVVELDWPSTLLGDIFRLCGLTSPLPVPTRCLFISSSTCLMHWSPSCSLL